MVHCHLIYGIHIWGSANISTLTDLFKRQKAAIRIITLSKYNAHTEPLFKSLFILPLHLLCDFFRLQFMHQYIQGLLPSSFDNTWTTNFNRRDVNLAVHLRNSDELYIPFSRLVQTDCHPYYKLPRIWQDFSEHSIKIIRSKEEFNSKLKTYLIETLSDTPNCTRILCPSCNPIFNN